MLEGGSHSPGEIEENHENRNRGEIRTEYLSTASPETRSKKRNL